MLKSQLAYILSVLVTPTWSYDIVFTCHTLKPCPYLSNDKGDANSSHDNQLVTEEVDYSSLTTVDTNVTYDSVVVTSWNCADAARGREHHTSFKWNISIEPIRDISNATAVSLQVMWPQRRDRMIRQTWRPCYIILAEMMTDRSLHEVPRLGDGHVTGWKSTIVTQSRSESICHHSRKLFSIHKG